MLIFLRQNVIYLKSVPFSGTSDKVNVYDVYSKTDFYRMRCKIYVPMSDEGERSRECNITHS